MTSNPFSEKMAQLSDEKLLEIAGPLRNDYQPKAVEAAEEEIGRRNLNVDLGKMKSDAEAEKEIAEQKKKSLVTTTGSIFTVGLLAAILQFYRLSKHEKTGTVVTNLVIIIGIAVVVVFFVTLYHKRRNK